jgi:tripartite-type tricarboxylate transporter receptor subunit TctC
MPNVPTVAESGVPGLAGYEVVSWQAIFAPAGTPKAIVDKLNAAFRQALEDPQVRENLVSRGAFPLPGPPDDLAQHIAREYPLWIRLVKDSGAKVD